MMKSKTANILRHCLTALLLAVVGLGAANPIGGPVQAQSGGVASMTLTLPAGPYTINKDKDGFDSIDMEGFSQSTAPGDPILPHRAFNIAVPPNILWQSLSLSVVSTQTSVLAGTYDIRPGQPFAAQAKGPPAVNWGGNTQIIDGKNMQVYSVNAFFPQNNVRRLPYSEMRKWKIANVDFCPFQYNPVSKTLSLAQSVTIRLSYNLAPATQALALLAYDTILDDVAAQTLFNYADLKSLYQPATSSPAYAPSAANNDYVIITTEAIQAGSSAKLASFVSHKQAQGHSVLVVTEGTWGAASGQSPDTKADRLRKWLQDNYISMGITYVLLIGDPSTYEDGEGDVPMKMCWPNITYYDSSERNSPTDYYYADLTGNWDINSNGYYGEWADYTTSGGVDLVPEVYVGRIPVYNADYSTLDSILQKTMDYDNATEVTWRKNALLPMSFSDSSTDGGYFGERLKDNFLTPSDYSYWTMYQRGSGPCNTNSAFTPSQALVSATTEMVRDRWAANPYGLVWWWGHGSSTGAYIGYSGCQWGCHLLESNDVTSLDNSHPAFTYMSSCENGWPSISNNLQYSILKQGGIATVSATRVSWYGVGEHNFANSSSNCGIGYQYMDNLLHTHSWTAGKALYEAKSYLRSNLSWGGQSLMNMCDFNLYGDPTVQLSANALPPTVNNAAGAGSIMATTAILNGNLTYTGGLETKVAIFSGKSDGYWTRSDNLSNVAAGPFSLGVMGLTPNTTYYYRCYAENTAGSSGAPSSASFTTQADLGLWKNYWAGPGKDWFWFSSGNP